VPTLRGWLVVGTGLAVLLTGVAFGAHAVEQLGFALLALVGIALLVVRRGRFSLVATRTVNPRRARPGQPVDVELAIANRGRGPAPLLLLEERLPPGVSASGRFALHGIEPGGDRSASISLRPARRGRYVIGPLEISVVDPFGLARVTDRAADTTELLVHPRIESLVLPRDLGERRSMSTSALRQLTGARGEDFYTLREYVDGDDLRRVHWSSTAKRGRYMIRQEETPWHTRASVLLDDRAAAHDSGAGDSSFERAVSAAASVVDLYHRSGYGFTLGTAHGRGVAGGRGTDHWNRCLDFLATVEPPRATPGDDALLLRLQEVERGMAPEAALVIVAGTLGASEAVAISRCARRFRQVTVIAFPAHRFGSAASRARWEGERQVVEAVRLMARAQVRPIVLGPDESLGAAWAASSSPGRTREGAWAPRVEPV
jgi:uncharacterized protein (DUF58 family)